MKTTWQIVPWDGNTELNFLCWRKKFGKGHVSVGIGEFKSVVYSYGPNSDDSLSSTRWNYDMPELDPVDVMVAVDKNHGKHGNIGHQTNLS